jgi:Overcoming lysogenization defect protein-like, TOPRIM domain
MNAVVLVEGISDRVALETLAARRGRDLGAEGVAVIEIGGAHAIGSFLDRFRGLRIAGLCDAGEQGIFRRALERAGFGPAGTRAEMARLGFFICVADLEDELIRALGPAAVEELFAQHGDLRAFRTFQHQPEWRGRPVERQMRRVLGSSVGKTRYARILVEALDLEHVPEPLDAVLAHI